MKRLLKNKDGFTLIEMVIVLMIISILLAIAVPQMAKTNDVVNSKSCKATKRLIKGQIGSYKVEHGGDIPATLDVLIEEGYVDTIACPDGTELSMEDIIQSDGTSDTSGTNG